jgi:phage-related minor tail protein
VSVDIPPEQLEAITGRAFSLEGAFGGVASEYITLADTFANQGLVGSAEEGLDYITTAFQQLPAEMQAPLTEAVTEYGGFMQDLGFSTDETFAILTSAAADGEIALDKTGDALKEFGIRATDGLRCAPACLIR